MTGDRLEDLIDSLKTQRDELRVQMHLAKAEIRDEWEEIERNGLARKPASKRSGPDA